MQYARKGISDKICLIFLFSLKQVFCCDIIDAVTKKIDKITHSTLNKRSFYYDNSRTNGKNRKRNSIPLCLPFQENKGQGGKGTSL